MDKKIILAVAGAGKTYDLCHRINQKNKNLILAYTNENIKNIKREIIDKFGKIPEETLIMTFDSFLYRYFIRPYEKLIFYKFKIKKIDTKGVDIYNLPEPSYKNGKYNWYYKKKENIEHYIIKNKYYCSRIPELILYVNDVMDMAITSINKYCDYIYIDEVQDFRQDYYKILENLVKRCNNIIMVGDYWQHSVNGQNNSGSPFKNTSYEEYIKKLKKLNLEVDNESLKYSRRCSKEICDFVSQKLGILIKSNDADKVGKVIFVHDFSKIIEVLENNEIIKLLNKNSKIYNFNSINWSYSKGNTYEDVCVILTDEFKNIERNDFVKPNKIVTNNQLYVALTRASKNLYIITKEDFDKIKDKYLK